MEMTTNYSGDIFTHIKKAATTLGRPIKNERVYASSVAYSVFDSGSWLAFHWERLNPRHFIFKCELGERNITSEGQIIHWFFNKNNCQ